MRNKKGISLIVLVITIIVMIILAAAVVVSLNNTGIIGKANVAVEATNKKQIEDLASLAWADAYMEGARTQEALEDAVLESLKDVDTSKYTIVVTEAGVSVNDGTDGLNEYGFYYDVPYVACFNEGTDDEYYIYAVLKSDGYGEGYIYAKEFEQYNVEPIAMFIEETKYEKGKILNPDGTEEGIFAPDGSSFTIGGELTYTKTNKQYNDVYYNTKYYFYGQEVYVILNTNNSVETYNYAGVKQNLSLELKGHLIFWEEEFVGGVSMNGKEIIINNFLGTAMVPNNGNKVSFELVNSDGAVISTHDADLDMTWREWIASSYNTIGAEIVTPTEGDEYITFTYNGVEDCVLKHNVLNNVYIISPDSYVLPGMLLYGDAMEE